MRCFHLILFCISSGLLFGATLGDEEDVNSHEKPSPSPSPNGGPSRSPGIRGGGEVPEDDGDEKGIVEDSHEAMNNREGSQNPINTNVENSEENEEPNDRIAMRRSKRSYEFLMGLINNNSRYQVTTNREEQPIMTTQTRNSRTSEEKKSSGDEMLLETIVRIASNPEHWMKIHQLLRQIDEDIQTSKQLLKNYQNHTNEIVKLIENVQRNDRDENNEDNEESEEERSGKRKYVQEEINKEVAISSDNGQPYLLKSYEVVNPTITPTKNTKIMGITRNTEGISTKIWPSFDKFSKTYPQNKFLYHRVTDKPIFVDKKPKAYVAVSAITPSSKQFKKNEELELEDELIQLKPSAWKTKKIQHLR